MNTVKPVSKKSKKVSEPVRRQSPVEVSRGCDDREYEAFLANVRNRFAMTREPLFTTNAHELGEHALLINANGQTRSVTGLFATYVAMLPEEHRAHHTCRSCEQFFNRFGALATIDENGRVASAVWDASDAPAFYRPAVEAIARLVRRSTITGVFLSSDKTFGQPQTGPWHHFAVENATPYRGSVLSASQKAAEKLEERGIVARALNEFSRETVQQAVTLLRSEALYRGEKVLGQAEWLLGLHDAFASKPGGNENILWRAVATAPAGFCHPRASMIGTLLEDIASGMGFQTVSRRFAEKMSPTQYQRPTAAPTMGAIATAEKLVEKLGVTRSLERRFARLDEIQAIWRPVPERRPRSTGVFSHLIPKRADNWNAGSPAITMTWEKFQRTVLPGAEKIEYYARDRVPYAALVTAVHPDAPCLFQWETHLSWYVHQGGSLPTQFGLPNGWVDVNAVAFKPSVGLGHQGEGVIFILNGAKDSSQQGSAIFPECLKAEFHGIRSVVEAFSNRGTIHGREQASACGLMLFKNQPWNNLFRVTSNGITVEYKLDRWD